jgi:pimeloyl-ACP methyl ester carboxylesterase
VETVGFDDLVKGGFESLKSGEAVKVLVQFPTNDLEVQNDTIGTVQGDHHMTVVFIHGVPETAAIWDDVRASMTTPSIAVELPGFGTPLPEGFAPDKDSYVAFVLDFLESVSGPIDLVGHDWGSLLTARIATHHGSRIRSWAADIGSLWHPEYVWHDFAQLWQSPAGEKWMADTVLDAISTPPTGFFESLSALGVPVAHVPVIAETFDDDMANSILGLYRSACPNIAADWNPAAGRDLQTRGTILQASKDPFDNCARADEVARALGVDVTVLGDFGHFWMLENPRSAASAIERWLSRVSSVIQAE